MWMTKCALFIWINFVIHASTSIFALKWHIINLMKEGTKKKKKKKEDAWKQEEAKEKKKPIKINLQNNKKSFKNELTMKILHCFKHFSIVDLSF